VHECHAVALQTLEDETFTAEEAGPHPLCKRNAHLGAVGGAQE
jgi:hypothetical protein